MPASPPQAAPTSTVIFQASVPATDICCAIVNHAAATMASINSSSGGATSHCEHIPAERVTLNLPMQQHAPHAAVVTGANAWGKLHTSSPVPALVVEAAQGTGGGCMGLRARTRMSDGAAVPGKKNVAGSKRPCGAGREAGRCGRTPQRCKEGKVPGLILIKMTRRHARKVGGLSFVVV